MHFDCGLENILEDVIETETCFYALTVQTPLACTPKLEKESMERLEDLGVFGFKRKDSTNTGNKNGNDVNTNTISNENSNNDNNEGDKVYTVQANGVIDVAIDGDVFA